MLGTCRAGRVANLEAAHRGGATGLERLLQVLGAKSRRVLDSLKALGLKARSDGKVYYDSKLELKRLVKVAAQGSSVPVKTGHTEPLQEIYRLR